MIELNQQQLELIARTVASGAAADAADLVLRALREYSARHVAELSRANELPDD
jgi:Arc/MetJ-type ribon-helix-helix transcriptional regulator